MSSLITPNFDQLSYLDKIPSCDVKTQILLNRHAGLFESLDEFDPFKILIRIDTPVTGVALRT